MVSFDQSEDLLSMKCELLYKCLSGFWCFVAKINVGGLIYFHLQGYPRLQVTDWGLQSWNAEKGSPNKGPSI